MKTFINTIFAVLISCSSALAASGAHEDNSGIFVWAFLALCALIIIGQLVPVFLVMLGFAKGVRKEKKAEST